MNDGQIRQLVLPCSGEPDIGARDRAERSARRAPSWGRHATGGIQVAPTQPPSQPARSSVARRADPPPHSGFFRSGKLSQNAGLGRSYGHRAAPHAPHLSRPSARCHLNRVRWRESWRNRLDGCEDGATLDQVGLPPRQYSFRSVLVAADGRNLNLRKPRQLPCKGLDSGQEVQCPDAEPNRLLLYQRALRVRQHAERQFAWNCYNFFVKVPRPIRFRRRLYLKQVHVVHH